VVPRLQVWGTAPASMGYRACKYGVPRLQVWGTAPASMGTAPASMGYRACKYGVPRLQVWGTAPASMGYRACKYGVLRLQVWGTAPASKGYYACKQYKFYVRKQLHDDAIKISSAKVSNILLKKKFYVCNSGSTHLNFYMKADKNLRRR